MMTNKKLYAKAIRLLSMRDHSVHEIKQKLLKFSEGKHPGGGWQSEARPDPPGVKDVINSVIDKLLEQKLLDDAKFTEYFIRFKLSQKPFGEMALFFQLKKKDIADSLAKASLKTFFSSPDVAFQLAREALLRKKITQTDAQKRFAKQVRFLASRGFSYPVIRRVIDDLAKKE